MIKINVENEDTTIALILKTDLNGLKLSINDQFSFYFFKARNTELTCEKKMMTITCLTGIIFIEDAIFGRTKNSSVCPHDQIKNTNCTSTRSEAIIKTKCDGVPVCSVEVDYDKLGGDPCPGTYKYLEVNFICY